MSAPVIQASDLDIVARTLWITDHDTGTRVRWVPNIEQREYWEANERHRFVYATKPRQVGLSTGVSLPDVLETMVADAGGDRWRTAIVVDTYEKALERIAICADFCAQMELEHRPTTERITFPNGSEIVAMTAAGARVGASLTVQRYHLTELPHYENPGEAYGSLMQSLTLGGRCTIETTMDTRTPFARDLWRAKNEYHKLFFRFERHTEYRMDPKDLTDEQWKMCQAEGFTRKDAAAYWLWLLETKVGGDMLRLMREYPQREEHMFQADAARFIRTTPTVSEPSCVWGVPGMAGEDLKVRVWRRPEEGSGQYVMGVDTAAGKEKDRSVVCVVDKRDSRICAVFVSDTVMADDLARVALDLQVKYSTVNQHGERFTCAALIEDNGIGEATCQAGSRLGLMYERVTMTEDMRYQNLLAVKRLVESGVIHGPKELAEECDELHRDELGRFKGRKDLLMAYGFCTARNRLTGYNAGKQPEDDRVRFKRKIVLQQMRARAGLT